MKGRKRGLLGAAPGIAVVGLAAAVLGVSDPESRMAVALLGLSGLIATLALGKTQRDPQAREFLGQLMLAGVGTRLLVFALVHQSVGPYVFAPDQRTFESLGLGLSYNWAGLGPVPSQLVGTLQVGFPILNAVMYTVFGQALAAVPVLNMFLSTWTAIPAYHLGMVLMRGNAPVARWVAGLTTFFPSLVLWSVLNVREAPTIFILVLALTFLVRFQLRGGLWDLLGALLALATLTVFREYLTALVAAAAGAGVLMGKSRSPGRSLIAGSLVLMILSLTAQQLGVAGTLIEEGSLETVQYLREDMARGAGSAFGVGSDVSTPGGALAFLPIGLAYFLLAPFPWAIGSTLQSVTLPETLVWYLVFPAGLWGLWLVVKHDLRRFTVPLTTIIVVSFAYALVEGNVGTAYRHRAQVLPLIFVFSAIGIRDVWALYAARRAKLRRAVPGSLTGRYGPAAGPGGSRGRHGSRGP